MVSAHNCSLLPLGWEDHVQAQRQLLSKLTWGQGTHDLQIPSARLTTLRATMTRALLRIGFYSLTPMILFTVVVQPSLEPLFALQVAALRALQRFCRHHNNRNFILQHLNGASLQQSGPLKRAQQLHRDPIYTAALQHILIHDSSDRSWEHGLRAVWRSHHWTIIARARPAFEGLQHVDRALAIELLQKWHSQADGFQKVLDHSLPGPHLQQDPRPRSKILTYILTGGLMSPSRDGRHRFRQSVQYSVRGVPNEVEHIHWHCRKYANLRAPIRSLLTRILRAPPCFQYAALPTTTMNFSQAQVLQIQEVLVNIWQQHITEWHDHDVDGWDPDEADPQLSPHSAPAHTGNEEPSDDAPQPSASSSSRPTAAAPMVEQDQRGHRIRHFGTGAFCVKCGVQTSRLEHVNLKILKKVCPYANLHSSSWISTPGKHTAKARLDEMEAKLHEVYYNQKPQHKIYWNRLLGKNSSDLTTYGRLWCRLCGRTFGWQYRHNNLPKTRCVPLNPPPVPPDWVPAEQNAINEAASSTTNAESSRPRRRLLRKTAVAST